LSRALEEVQAVKSASYRGVVKGQTIVLSESPAPLADGTEVLVMPLPLEPGTPAAILAAMEAEPHLTREDVEELEQAIEQGRRPPVRIEPFPGESEGAGGV
jgi:hypothetical protein